jgi:hypothetical protein
MFRPTPHTRITLAAILAAQSLLSGCACLPRIDPSGERFLVFPSQQPAAPAGTVGAPAPTFSGGAGNVVAPPVLSDGTASASTSNDCLGCGNLYDQVFHGDRSSTAVDPANGQVVDVPEERLTLTPSKVLAPVGSEVVLRAGVCNQDGFTRTNRRVEWMLGQQGSGQFVEIGEEGESDIFRLPWEKSKKIDNTYAVSYSTPVHKCLDRGTADTTDDLQITPGDAWVTVTSAAEGTSYVTAYAPSVGNWPARRSIATIYWVDAQWQFPPSVTVPAGQKHILTTTITRKTDGAPIAGWIVRYTVQGGSGARLGYEARQTTEATTDNRGRASVELTPTDNGPGTTNVSITVIRPEQAGVAASPRVEVGTGAAAITWSPTALPIAPEPGTGTTIPPQYLPPSPPPTTTPPLATGAPDLEVRITSPDSPDVELGKPAKLLITVRNAGTAPARDVLVRAEFDRGLSQAAANPGVYAVNPQQKYNIGPGESIELPVLEFGTLALGKQCVVAEASLNGVSQGSDRYCVNVIPPASAAAPQLEISIQGERQKTVGQIATFPFVIRNTGTTPASNMLVTVNFDPALEPVNTEALQRPGVLQFTAGRLESGGQTSLQLPFKCVQPDPVATVSVTAVADNMQREARASWDLEVLGPINSPNDGGVAPAASNIQATIDTRSVQVGKNATIYVTLMNTGQLPERNVQFRIGIPAQLRPDVDAIRNAISAPNVKFTVNPPYLVFDPIAELRPNEPLSVLVVVTATAAGDANFTVEYKSDSMPAAQSRTQVINVAPR